MHLTDDALLEWHFNRHTAYGNDPIPIASTLLPILQPPPGGQPAT